MRERLRRLLPTPHALSQNRWLRWLGPALHHPRLWHSSRRGIALGVALGVFFGFLVPIAQIPLAAAAAVALRANVPMAAVSTLVTNPFTFPPIYYAAWRVGGAILGENVDNPPPPPVISYYFYDDDVATQTTHTTSAAVTRVEGNWFERAWHAVAGVGRPLILGLVIFACGFGAAVYVLIHLGWMVYVHLKRRLRLRRALAT